MPALARTSDSDILTAARQIIEQQGTAGFSLHAVAEAVGVRPPSLYKRFKDREAILRAVQHAAFAEFGTQIANLPPNQSPDALLRGIARLFWRFAHEKPHLYTVMFAASPVVDEKDIAVRREVLKPLFDACELLVGRENGLAAARTLTAYFHGFVSMKIAGAFHLGGNVEEAFWFGFDTLLIGLTTKEKS